MRIKSDRKKVDEGWNCKKINFKIILNKINSNQKNKNQTWQMRKPKDEIEKKL
jgi:hypothetical protein